MNQYEGAHQELERFKKECAANYKRVVAWIEQERHRPPEIKYFFPESELNPKDLGDKLLYNATAKPRYRWTGIEISAEVAVKYQLPYLIRRQPLPCFQHPRNLHFRKAGENVINEVYFLYDGNRDVGIGHETIRGKQVFHKVITRYEIVYGWQQNYMPLVQQSLFN